LQFSYALEERKVYSLVIKGVLLESRV
jgi:hypothetical protein